MWSELLNLLSQQLSNMQYGVSQSHRAIYYIPRTSFFYNLKFVPFDSLHPFCSPSNPRKSFFFLSFLNWGNIGLWASLVALVVKNPSTNAGDIRDTGSILGQKDLLKEGMAITSVFLPGKSHGQRSLADYSPRGCKELDTTEVT